MEFQLVKFDELLITIVVDYLFKYRKLVLELDTEAFKVYDPYYK